jgi:hypothetical protein
MIYPFKSNYYSRLSAILALIQSIYFFITGIWPILHIDSFMQISGLKTDLWLVKTVGALIIVIAVSIFSAYKLKELIFPIVLLSIGSSGALLMIDVVYVTAGIISPVYLADGLFEILLILGWAFVLLKK